MKVINYIIQPALKVILYSCFIFTLQSFSPVLISQAEAQSSKFPRLVFDPVPLQLELQNPGSDEPPEIIPIVSEIADNPVDEQSSPPLPTNELINTLLQNQNNYETQLAELIQRIEQYELQGGPYDQRLGQEFSDIGNLYFKQQDYLAAIEAYSRALHATRINEGLYTIAQIPIVERLILSYLSSKDFSAAHEQQRYLYFLKKRIYRNANDEYLKNTVAFADWNLYAFINKYDINTVHLFNDDLFFSEIIDTPFPTDGQIDFLSNAYNSYKQSLLQSRLNPSLISNNELIRLERNYLVTLYLINIYTVPVYDYRSAFPSDFQNQGSPLDNLESYPEKHFRDGREILNIQIQRIRQREGDTPELIQAYIRLADWHLLFDKRNSSLDIYEQAYERASSNEYIEDINAFFNPYIPVSLPEFFPTRYSRGYYDISPNTPLNHQGYIDMQFEINRYGKAHAFKMLSHSDEMPEDMEDFLIRHLRRTLFRPMIGNAQMLEDTDAIIQLRYYYSYL